MSDYTIKGNRVKTVTLDEGIAKLKQYERNTSNSDSSYTIHAIKFGSACDFLASLFDTTSQKVLEKLAEG